MIDREAAVEVLTTHRHGERRELCAWCANYYGQLVDALNEAGVS